MSSFKGKVIHSDNVSIADGSKSTNPSKKHYRPHHICLNKKMEYFDNDTMWVIMVTKDDDIEMKFGINKDKWRYSDHDLNDESKDGNGRY